MLFRSDQETERPADRRPGRPSTRANCGPREDGHAPWSPGHRGHEGQEPLRQPLPPWRRLVADPPDCRASAPEQADLVVWLSWTVALGRPAVVGRMTAGHVHAVPAARLPAAPRPGHLSKVGSLHRDQPRRRPWLSRSRPPGSLLRAHVRSARSSCAPLPSDESGAAHAHCQSSQTGKG